VATLADSLSYRGLAVVLSAAPDAQERAFTAAVVAAARTPLIDLSGQLSLRELAALAGGARLFAGVDSAPMHMAAAMGTPTVAIFGPSGELEWGPWNVPHRVVASDVHPCRPCGLDGCGGGKISECLTTLPVERVLAACDQLLAP
jgi:heptosyltransferase-3